MKLESFTPAQPLVDERLGTPRHAFDVHQADVASIDTVEGGVVVTFRRDSGPLRVFFGAGGAGRLAEEKKK